MRAHPHGVELLHDGRDEGRVRGQQAGLEVAAVRAFRAHARAGQVGAARVRDPAVHDDRFEVHAGTEDALHPVNQILVAIEIAAKQRARLLRVQQADLDPPARQFGQHAKEGNHALPARDMQVLEIGGRQPEKLLRTGDRLLNDPFVNLKIADEFRTIHGSVPRKCFIHCVFFCAPPSPRFNGAYRVFGACKGGSLTPHRPHKVGSTGKQLFVARLFVAELGGTKTAGNKTGNQQLNNGQLSSPLLRLDRTPILTQYRAP